MQKIWCMELAAEITEIIEGEEDAVEAGGKVMEYLRGKQDAGGLKVCDNQQI